MQAGVSHVILFHGGGNGADVADVLHDSRQRDGSDGDNGGQQHTAVKILAEDGEGGVAPDHGQADPIGLGHGLGNVGTGGGIHDHGEQVGAENAQQNGNDLHHALAPDVADHDDQDRDQRDPPVAAAVIDGGTGQRQADADDDGAGDDGREEAHDFLRAEELEEERQNQIYKTRHGNAEAGVGQRNVLSGSGDQTVSTQKREGGAQECGNLPSGDQVEQQRAETGKEQGSGYVQSGDCGNQNRCTEHCEQVLQAQNQHFGGTQSTCVINRVGILFGSSHKNHPFCLLQIYVFS